MVAVTDPTPWTRVETISPGQAQSILDEANIDNRRVRRWKVAEYALQMRRGEWMTTGQGITFDTNGRLVDGQHRLLAIIDAAMPVTMTVCHDADPRTFEIVDTGMNRQQSDVIAQSGFAYANQTAGTSRCVLAWRAGALDRTTMRTVLTRRDVVEFATEHYHRGLLESMQLAERLAVNVGGSRTAWSALVFEVRTLDRHDLLASFFEAILTGENLAQGDPRLTLRNYVTARRSGLSRGGRSRVQMRTEPLIAVQTYTKALNAFCAGTPMQKLHTWTAKYGRVRPELGAHPTVVAKVA